MRQKASAQAFATAYSVSRLTSVPPATSTQARALPSAMPASSSPTLPMKPESGGMPARFMAGMKNSTPTSG